MGNATVTIKLTPTEFDLIRTALECAKKSCIKGMEEAENGTPVHRANRERAGQYTDLLRRLA